MGTMRSIIKSVCLNALSIYLLSLVFTGLKFSSPLVLFEAAFILGFLNTFVKPILSLLTLPINLVTFGFFSFILNLFIIFLVTKIVPGFNVSGFMLTGLPYLGTITLDALGAYFLVSVGLNFVNGILRVLLN